MTEKSGKRRYGIIAACAVLALVLTAGAYRLGRSAGGGADIGEEAAKLAALGHAQVSEASLTRYGISRDRNNGRTVYEVEFTADGVEYDYEINAADGSVLKFEKEVDDRAPAAQVSSGDSAGMGIPADSASGDAAYIGEARAREIAYAHAGVAAGDVLHCDMELDHHDHHGAHHGAGCCAYEIDFKCGGYEYGYKVDALTGEILKSQREVDD